VSFPHEATGEAAFSANGGYCRVDILRPALNDAWDIIEVKSTTSLKDVHLDDLAFQTWVLTSAGLKIRACYLCQINSDFVRRGEIDPKKFFVLEVVTAQVVSLSRNVEDKLGDMFKAIRQPQHPDIRIGPHCDDPYTCALHDHCWKFLPEHNVLDLYRGTKKGFGLLDPLPNWKSLCSIPGPCATFVCKDSRRLSPMRPITAVAE
jgi:hypothetical protein